MSAATFGPTAIGDLAAPYRRRIVERVLDQVESGNVDTRTALLMLTASGLTADPVALEDAVTGRDTSAGLRDGRLQPCDVDPGIRLPGDQARDWLINRMDEQAAEAIAILATAVRQAVTA